MSDKADTVSAADWRDAWALIERAGAWVEDPGWRDLSARLFARAPHPDEVDRLSALPFARWLDRRLADVLAEATTATDDRAGDLGYEHAVLEDVRSRFRDGDGPAVGTCSTCKHWDPTAANTTNDWGTCTIVPDSEGYAEAPFRAENVRADTGPEGDPAWLTTRDDFGCVNHEPSPPTPENPA